MLNALYIFVDDDFADPVYADPSVEDQDEAMFTAVCEAANDAFEGDARPNGHKDWHDSMICWRFQSRLGLTFVAVVSDDIRAGQVDQFLTDLSRQYLDEVDDPRHPERAGVADVVVDVIPPWEI